MIRSRLPTIQMKHKQTEFGLQQTKRSEASSTSRKVPKLLISLADLSSVDKSCVQNTDSFRLLKENLSLTTPRSIHQFIQEQSISEINQHAASIIQRNWIRYKIRRKVKKMIKSLILFNRHYVQYCYSMWRLSKPIPADIASIHFKKVENYLIYSGSYRTILNKDRYLNLEQMNLATFDTYMKTGLIMFDPKCNQNRIISFVRIMMRRTLSKLINDWYVLSYENIIMRRSTRLFAYLAQQRRNFGPMYWTYHFWKRWTRYKRFGSFSAIVKMKGYFFLPEWMYFRYVKDCKINQSEMVAKIHDHKMIHNILEYMKLRTVKYQNKMRNIKSIAMKVDNITMKTAYRALQHLMAFKKIRDGLVFRTFRAWYVTIDKNKILKVNERFFSERINVNLILKYVKLWRTNVIGEIANICLTQSKLLSSKSSPLCYAFLLLGDFTHYSFISAFRWWRSLIIMRKRTRKLQTWSLKASKQMAVKRFIFDCLRVNSDKPVNKQNYFPFIIDLSLKEENDTKKVKYQKIMEDGNNVEDSTIVQTPLSSDNNTSSEGRLESLISKLSLEYHSIPADVCLKGHSSVEEYEMAKGGFDEWTSKQVQDFFYQLIIIATTPKDLQRKKTSTHASRAQEMRSFKLEHRVFNQSDLHEFRLCQSKMIESKILKFRDYAARDRELILSMSAHDAAIQFNKVVPKFSILDKSVMVKELQESLRSRNQNKKSKGKKNKERVDFIDEKSIATDNFPTVDEERASDSLDLAPTYVYKHHHTNGGRALSASTYHPLLQPIDTIKSSVVDNERKYRRDPSEVFSVRADKKKFVLASTNDTQGNLALLRQLSIYESFIPIRTDIDIVPGTNIDPISLNDYQKLSPNFSRDESAEEEDSNTNVPLENDSTLSSSAKFELGENQTSFKEASLPKKVSFAVLSKLRNKSQDQSEGTDEEHNEKFEADKMSGGLLGASSSSSVSNVSNPEIRSALDNLSDGFMRDQGYQSRCRNEQIGYLTKRYLNVLEILLDDKQKQSMTMDLNASQNDTNIRDEPQINLRITQLLRKLVPQGAVSNTIEKEHAEDQRKIQERKEVRGQRRNLFNDPDNMFEKVIGPDGKEYEKSKCQGFANVLFCGTDVLLDSASNKKKYVGKPQSSSSIPSSLPCARITVKGYENIQGFDDLAGKISDFIGKDSNYSTKNSSEGFWFQFSLKNNAKWTRTVNPLTGMPFKTDVVRIADRIATETVKIEVDEDTKNQESTLDNLVDIEKGIPLDKEKTETEYADSTTERSKTSKLTIKSSYSDLLERAKKRTAFKPENRTIKEKHVLEDRLTFTTEILRCVTEGSRLTRPYVLATYDSLERIKPFEGLEELRKNVQKRISQYNAFKDRDKTAMNYVRPINQDKTDPLEINLKQLKEVEIGNGEIALTIGGLDSRLKPQKIKSTVTKEDKDYIKIQTKVTKGRLGNVSLISGASKSAIDPDTGRPIMSPTQLDTTDKGSDGGLVPELETNNSKHTSRRRVSGKDPYLHPSSTKIVHGSIKITKYDSSQRPSTALPVNSRSRTIPKLPSTHSTANSECLPNGLASRVSDSRVREGRQVKTRTYKARPFQPKILPREDTRSGSSSNTSRRSKMIISKPEWIFESDPVVTENDIDLFMFVTPYVLPPEMINQYLGRSENSATSGNSSSHDFV